MKRIFYLLTGMLLWVSCSSPKSEKLPGDSLHIAFDSAVELPTESGSVPSSSMRMPYRWKGTINGSIPVIVFLEIRDSLCAGQIVYERTKAKRPIPLMGTIDAHHIFRLLEFAPDGSITGILTGTKTDTLLTGQWFSPTTRKAWPLQLTPNDSLLAKFDFLNEAEKGQLTGTYSYAYGKEGATGTLTVKQIDDTRLAFGIEAFTSAPARNMAIVDTDTVTFQHPSFVYQLETTPTCQFRVVFFRKFAYVNYTRSYDGCIGEFGHNATVDGIFFKTSDK